MKKLNFLLTLWFLVQIQLSWATTMNQDTTPPVAKILPDTSDLTINYLKVPTSAAFNLMGISPSSIDEPKIPGDFLLALNNATDDFTKIPKSYAMEFAPAWVFNKEDIDFSQTISNKFGQNLRQSLVISMGINPIDDPFLPPGNLDITEVGLGVKASLIRGTVKSEFERIDSMYQVLATVNDSFYLNTQKYLAEDPEYKMLSDSIEMVGEKLQNNSELVSSLSPVLKNLTQRITSRSETLLQDTVRFKQEVTNKFVGQLAAYKSIGEVTKFNRQGFKLDFAAGFVSNFRNASFDSTRISRIGAWLTGGWTINSKNSSNASTFLGVLRLTGNPNQIYKSGTSLLTNNNLFFDYGGRLIFHNGERLSISGELVGRIPINNDLLSSTSRYTFNLEYQATKSIILTLNLGKDFNGVVSNSGNLLTALHLFSYFGNRSYDTSGNQVK